MSESILNRPIDTDGNPSRYVVIALILGIVALISGWTAVVELQFMMFSKTIEGDLKTNGQVEYKDGEDTRLEHLIPKEEIKRVGPTEIEILPGFGRARLPGTRYFMPFVVFGGSLTVAGILLIPILRQGRDYAEDSEDRDEARFDWKNSEDE